MTTGRGQRDRNAVLRLAVVLPPGVVLVVALLYLARHAVIDERPPTRMVDEGVFDPAPVHDYQIAISEKRLQNLRENPRAYVKGVWGDGDKILKDVGIRLKGGAGSFRELDDKPAFTIKFDQYVKGQRYRGLRKLSLNNAVQDPTYLSNFIGNELFRAAGVPAPRIGHARVALNGKDLGLYVVLEARTRDFLSRWFDDPSGNLYQGPGEIDSDDLALNAGNAAHERADLRTLAEAAAERDPTARWERLSRILDMDRFASFLAMEMITSHWDGYATATNNYNVYFDPGTQRLVFFPHDLDQIFGDPEGSMYQPASALVARAFRATPLGRDLFRARVMALTERHLDPDAIAARLEERYRKIHPVIARFDPEQAQAHREALDAMIGSIRARAASLKEQFLLPEPPPPEPLAFEDGRARPLGWEHRASIGEPAFARATRDGRDGKPALRISLSGRGEWCGSFRTRVLVPAGRYRFVGLVKTEGVMPLAQQDEEPPSGAGLRISGLHPSHQLLGDCDWTWLQFEFTVECTDQTEDGTAIGSAELVCELRAADGSAWFDEGSLELVRLPEEDADGR